MKLSLKVDIKFIVYLHEHQYRMGQISDLGLYICMSMFYYNSLMWHCLTHPIIENNEKYMMFDTGIHHNNSRPFVPVIRWQRLVAGVQLVNGWGYHCLKWERKQFRYGGVGMHWIKMNT